MVGKFERDESTLSVEQVKKIAEYLETSSGYLIDGEESESEAKWKRKYEDLNIKYIALLESQGGINNTQGSNNFNAQNVQK